MENSDKKHKIFKKVMTIIGIIISVIFVTIFVAWGGINISKFIVYNEYYKLDKNLASVPGIKDGFVASGITYLNNEKNYALVGSLNKTNENYLYVVNNRNVYEDYKLVIDGEPLKDEHIDITYYEGIVYLSIEKNENNSSKYGIYSFKFEDYENKESIDIGKRIGTTLTNCSFISNDNDYVYVGENIIGQNRDAKLIKYSLTDKYFLIPLDTYYIKDNVKGALVINNKLVTISNADYSDTYFDIFDTNDVDNVLGVKKLKDPVKRIKAPMLLVGLDVNENLDKLLFTSISGSSKYVFGSMFFSNKIRELNISKVVYK